ncbi:hypothetical protein [Novosphingobium sp.]|uniref:hypothetical protein n=1 Tax=Novosphingobium sp. TaxID=1874826 RepID=UPI00286D6162|nr:hypothetical protein [Novosphingobium sp.]
MSAPQSESRGGNRWAALASMAVSLALLIAVALQFRDLDLAALLRLLPLSPVFWLAFAGYYLALPISEWVIYRRLWHFPSAGFGALLRKLVSNELLLGYLGEAQFYAWVRARGRVDNAPFAAIKDITILSALAGNLATLVMLALAWPYVSAGQLGLQGQTAFAALGVVLLTSLAILLFRQKLFTLPQRELAFIAAVHVVRIAAVLLLSAVMWHAVLPAVALTMWLVLATLRQLISRLPLMPNKDVVFAGLTVLLLGNGAQVAALMAMMAVLLLVTHLAVGTVFGLLGLIDTEKTK